MEGLLGLERVKEKKMLERRKFGKKVERKLGLQKEREKWWKFKLNRKKRNETKTEKKNEKAE